jgi:hypothetical protein
MAEIKVFIFESSIFKFNKEEKDKKKKAGCTGIHL